MIGFPDTTGTFHTELLKLFVCTQLDSLRGLITLESLVVMCLVVSYIIRLRLAAIFSSSPELYPYVFCQRS